MLKQSVNLKLGTSLKLTPQLKAGLRILQMSVLDLQAEITQQLESNVMLERSDINPNDTQALQVLREDYKPPKDNDSSNDSGNATNTDTTVDSTDKEPASSDAWDDIATSELDTNYTREAKSSGVSSDKRPEIADLREASLGDHLAEQLNLNYLDDAERLVFEFLIDALDDDGFLCEPLAEINQSLSLYLPELKVSDLKQALKILQQCEPAGIAAIDLADSLRLQLQRLIKVGKGKISDEKLEIMNVAMVVTEHLDLLAKKQLSPLRRQCRTSVPKLEQAIKLIRNLNPRPGAAFAQTENVHMVPDVVVKRHQDQWVLEINQQILPKVHVNKQYAQSIRGKGNDGLKQQLQEARWLINGLEMRQQTLVKLSQAIISRQSGFLENGETAMQPMMMRELAQELSVHESTISRVVANKYMQTPRGTYPLRFFFSSQIKTESGEAHSATAIKGEIAKLIKAEDKAKPLSDSKLVTLLNDIGIPVARRTVAKYREALGLPSSSERRQK